MDKTCTPENSLCTFYEDLGFEEVEIEDGLTALCVEEKLDGPYGLLTDEAGNIPASLAKGLVFACYSEQDAFLWSATFKNSQQFRDLWLKAASLPDRFAAIAEYSQKQHEE
ncbi:MAG: hypothetical protein E6713_03665 [Sporomusaceae bacterium]|nr:hypothetical protein [Sporomusaceae bacterium]